MTFRLETFEVVEVVRPIESGMTQPYLCQLSDERLYAVKGQSALSRGLIAEVVSGWLAHKLNIPVPFFGLASLPRELLRFYEDKELDRSLGQGILFASLWQEPVEAMVMPLLRNMSKSTLATIYVFDHWIMNGDRTLSEHGGNPNLLIGLDSNSLIAIDHNLAFSNDYRSTELEWHACRESWVQQSRNFIFLDELQHKMRSISRDLHEITDQLPDQWLDDDEDVLSDIKRTLERINKPAFWGELS